MPQMFMEEGGVLSFSLILGGEILLLLVTGFFLHMLLRLLMGRIKSLSDNEALTKRCDYVIRLSRTLSILVTLLLVVVVVCFNCWFLFNDENVYEVTLKLIDDLPEGAWLILTQSIALIVLAVVIARVLNVVIEKLLAGLEKRAKAWDDLKANDESLSLFFSGIQRILVNVTWIFVVIFTFQQLRLPEVFTEVLYTIVTVYLIIAVGLSIVRMTNVIVDTLDGLSKQYAERRSWHQYYNTLRPLVPLFRKCLEYVLWLVVATLVLWQLEPIRGIASYGPRLMEAIGIYFIVRVVIEVGYLMIGKQVMGTQQLDDMERRRRETLLPLIKSVFKNVAYFICFVLVLRTLGFDPMPFLAGAGILGVVIGLGAQPLINDIMSGFFIILEHMYLVGDIVEGGGAYGVVERIDFRTTKVRDFEGRLHILRNGDMRQIINYSKDFGYAVVDVDVRHDAQIHEVMRLLEQMGKDINDDLDDVIAITEIFGITELNHHYVRIRTKTRVRAGEHAVIAAEIRLRVKCLFEEHDLLPPVPRQDITINKTA